MSLSIPTVIEGVKPISSDDADKHIAGKSAPLIFWYYIFVCAYYLKTKPNINWIIDAVTRWANGDKHVFDFWSTKYPLSHRLGDCRCWPYASPEANAWFSVNWIYYDWDHNGGGFRDKITEEQIAFWTWKKIDFNVSGAMIEQTDQVTIDTTIVTDTFDSDIDDDDPMLSDTPPELELEGVDFKHQASIIPLLQKRDKSFTDKIYIIFYNLFTGLYNWFLHFIGQREKEPLEISVILDRLVNNLISATKG